MPRPTSANMMNQGTRGKQGVGFTSELDLHGTPEKTGYVTLLGRALRLRCPRCGEGFLFRDWWHMRHQCDWCGLVYEREPGFFLGSVYINYGLTAVIITAAYFAIFFAELLPARTTLWLLAGFCFVFPVWFFRYARSLWLAMDFYWDPRHD